MSHVTIDLPEDDAAKLAERARERHSTPEALAAEAVRDYLHQSHQLGFIALGASGTHDTAAKAEEILRAEFPA